MLQAISITEEYPSLVYTGDVMRESKIYGQETFGDRREVYYLRKVDVTHRMDS
jgi:hypothetical protein